MAGGQNELMNIIYNTEIKNKIIHYNINLNRPQILIIMTEPKTDFIRLIKRQTDYSDETILKKLKEHENNVEKIILEYNEFDSNPKKADITTNQKIFKAIRENMNEINTSR